jgi:endonuclease-8
MPEGDTIRTAANRVGQALIEREIESIETPHPRFGKDRWPEKLAGRAVRAVDAHGKHLMIRFDGGLTIHSHLRMTGSWGVYPRGRRWHRGRHRAWLVIRTADAEVVQFDGPVLELMTDGRTRFDPRITQLGPDILADEFNDAAFIHRLRADDPTRTFGDALLDQRIVAGIGNMWKAEGCWRAQIDPWRRIREVSDDEALSVIGAVRPPMFESVTNGFPKSETLFVYRRAGAPCSRCQTAIRARGQGDDNRTTYWCPGCQR